MKTRSKKRLRASVFLEAARRVGENCQACWFACNALRRSRRDEAALERAFFERVLMPMRDGDGVPVVSGLPWYGQSYNREEEYNEQTARILGLILCALLVKEGWK